MDASREAEIYRKQMELADADTQHREALLNSWDEETRRAVLEEEAASKHVDLESGRRIRVSVPDQGFADMVGQVIDSRYRLDRRLDNGGGMGEVYLAEDLRPRDDEDDSRQVAVKLLPLTSPGLASRFRREKQILFDLAHSGIVRAFDGGTFEGRPYFVMEWIRDGLHLDAYCDRRMLDADDRVRLLVEVCEAVSYAHERKIVHRDLKPANILVTPQGEPKLLDFGVAKILMGTANETRHDEVIGTPPFTSPEQRAPAHITPLADQYALGVILFKLIANSYPHENHIVRPSKQAPKGAPIHKVRRGRRRDLDAIILKMLKNDPADRFVSIDELRDNLDRWLKKQPLEFTRRSRIYRLGRFVTRHPRVSVILTAFLGVAMAVGAGYYYQLGGARQMAMALIGHAVDMRQKEDAIDTLSDRVRVLAYELARRMVADGRPDSAHVVINELKAKTIEEQLIRAETDRLVVPFNNRTDGNVRLVYEYGGDVVFESGNGRVRTREQPTKDFDGALVAAVDGAPFAVGFERGTYLAIDRKGWLSLLSTTSMTATPLGSLTGEPHGASAAPDGSHLSVIDNAGLVIVAKADNHIHRQPGVREARWLSPDRLLMRNEQGVELLELKTKAVTPIPRLAGATALAVSRDGLVAALLPQELVLVDWLRLNVPVGTLRERVRACAFSHSGRKLAVIRENGQVATFLIDRSFEDGDKRRGLRPLVVAEIEGSPSVDDATLRFTRDDALLLMSGPRPIVLGASSLRRVTTFARPEQGNSAVALWQSTRVFETGPATFTGTGDLFIVTAQGLELRTPDGNRVLKAIENSPTQGRRVVPSPDLADVLLVTDTELSRWTVATLEKRWTAALPISSGPAETTQAPSIAGPVWSSDGQLVAIRVGGMLRVLNAATGSVQASNDSVPQAAGLTFVKDSADVIAVRLTTAESSDGETGTFQQERDYQASDLTLGREGRAPEGRSHPRSASACLAADVQGDGSILVTSANGERRLVRLEGLDELPDFVQVHPTHKAVLAQRSGGTRVWVLGVSDAAARCTTW